MGAGGGGCRRWQGARGPLSRCWKSAQAPRRGSKPLMLLCAQGSLTCHEGFINVSCLMKTCLVPVWRGCSPCGPGSGRFVFTCFQPILGPGQSSLVCWRGMNAISRGGRAFLSPASSLSKAPLAGCCSVPPGTPRAASAFPDLHTSWRVRWDLRRASSSGRPHRGDLLPQQLQQAPAPVLHGMECGAVGWSAVPWLTLSPGPAWDS